MKPRWSGSFIIKKTCQEVPQGLQIWIRKRCFVRLTWICTGSTTFEKEKEEKILLV